MNKCLVCTKEGAVLVDVMLTRPMRIAICAQDVERWRKFGLVIKEVPTVASGAGLPPQGGFATRPASESTVATRSTATSSLLGRVSEGRV